MKYPKTIGPKNIEETLFKHLNRFEQRFLNAEEIGSPNRYEVRIDGVRVIGPTEAAHEFSNLVNYLDLEDTETVEVRIYHGQSKYNDQYIFTLFHAPEPSESLGGIDHHVKSEVEKMRQQMAYDQLKKDYDDLVSEVKEQNQYVEKIEGELENYRSRRFYLGDVNLLDVGGVVLEGVLKRNAHLLGKLAAGPGLGGPPESPGPEVDPELIEVCAQIQDAFAAEDLHHLMELLNLLAHAPQKLPEVLAFVGEPQVQNP